LLDGLRIGAKYVALTCTTGGRFPDTAPRSVTSRSAQQHGEDGDDDRTIGRSMKN